MNIDKTQPEKVSWPTLYPDVNAVLHELLSSVQSVLMDCFVGMYLYGSLASGDFDPGRSDIDFLVVTSRELPKNLISDLEAMHIRIGASGLEWAVKLEGAYIPKYAMYRYDPSGPSCPMINEGKFRVRRQGIDWVINRHILRTNGVVITGPPLKAMIDFVEPQELRQAASDLLRNLWATWIDDSDFFSHHGYQSFAVLTMCRALYTVKYGKVASKSVSADWARTVLDGRWSTVIEHALVWHHGDASGDIGQTVEFVRFAVASVE